MEKSYRDYLAATARTPKTIRANQRLAVAAFNRDLFAPGIAQVVETEAESLPLLGPAETRDDDLARVPVLRDGRLEWLSLDAVRVVRRVAPDGASPSPSKDAGRVVAESAHDEARVELRAVDHEFIASEVAESVGFGRARSEARYLAELIWCELRGPGTWSILPESCSDPGQPGRCEIESAVAHALNQADLKSDIQKAIGDELAPYLVYRAGEVERAGDALLERLERERTEAEDLREEVENARDEWRRAAERLNDMLDLPAEARLDPASISANDLIMIVNRTTSRHEATRRDLAARLGMPEEASWAEVADRAGRLARDAEVGGAAEWLIQASKILGCEPDGDSVLGAIRQVQRDGGEGGREAEATLEREIARLRAQLEREHASVIEIDRERAELRTRLATTSDSRLRQDARTQRAHDLAGLPREFGGRPTTRDPAAIEDLDDAAEVLIEHARRLAALERLAVGRMAGDAEAVEAPRDRDLEWLRSQMYDSEADDLRDLCARVAELTRCDPTADQARLAVETLVSECDRRGIEIVERGVERDRLIAFTSQALGVSGILSLDQALSLYDHRLRAAESRAPASGEESIRGAETDGEALDRAAGELDRARRSALALAERPVGEDCARALRSLASHLEDQVEIGAVALGRRHLASARQ